MDFGFSQSKPEQKHWLECNLIQTVRKTRYNNEAQLFEFLSSKRISILLLMKIRHSPFFVEAKISRIWIEILWIREKDEG